VVPFEARGTGTRLMEARPAGPAVARLGRIVPPLVRLLRRLEAVRPAYVVAGFVVLEWAVTLAVAAAVGHDGWVFSRGTGQASQYTTSLHLRHREIVPTHGGYGWPTLLLPFALVGGSHLLHVLPAIVLTNVLVLMPVAMAATYGIAERLAGRLFGYWTLALWLVVPLVGIKYTDTGFKQRYTELSLPVGLGLTAGAGLAAAAMLAVAGYFCLRALQGTSPADGLLAGSFAGFAIGIEPAASLFLGGALAALVLYRQWRSLATVALGLAPCVLALAFWKWRSLGAVHLFAVDQHWGQFGGSLDSLREHFWSERVVEWTVVAGLVGLARRKLAALLLIGGWFVAFAVWGGTSSGGVLETGALLRLLVPAIPAFVLLVAAMVFLLPRMPSRLAPPPAPRPWGTPFLRATFVGATVLLFAVVPVVVAAVAVRTP
jgi:hypothetical protein